jgi:hypothetical protein
MNSTYKPPIYHQNLRGGAHPVYCINLMQLQYDLFVIYIRNLIGTKGTEIDGNYGNSKKF